MTKFRTGGHWGITIVQEGTESPDASGRRSDDQLAAVAMNGLIHARDTELEALIASLLARNPKAVAEASSDEELAALVCTMLNWVERQRAMVRHGRELLGDSTTPGETP